MERQSHAPVDQAPPVDTWGLVCPACRGPLRFAAGAAACDACRETYAIADGIPSFLRDEETAWASYHETNPNYARADPLPPHPYYAQHVPSGTRRLLDLGAGDGVMSAGALDRASLVYCVDASRSGLARLTRRGERRMLPVAAMAERLPFADGFFDVVLMAFLIEHVRDDRAVLREVRRVLAADGRLIVSTDAPLYDRYIRPLSRRLVDPRINAPEPTHVNLLTPEALRARLREAGFASFYEHLWWTGERHRWWRPVLVVLKSLPIGRRVKETLLVSGFLMVCTPTIRMAEYDL